MGRAQGTRHAVALGGFDAVIGQRRGSPTAQAARDADEDAQARRQLRAHAGERFLRACARFAVVPGLGETLLDSYERGECDPQHPGFERWVAQLAQACRTDQMTRLAITGGLLAGDPEGAEGLTAPWQEALAGYLAHCDWPRGVEMTVQFLFPSESSAEHFERLRGVCAAVGQFIATTAAGARTSAEEPADQACKQAAEILARAPAGTASGPLASWVDAFAARLACGRLTGYERRQLQLALDTATDPADRAALSGLAKLLA